MTVSKISGSQVSLGVSPLSWTNDVLAELGGDIPLEVCLKDAADNGYDGVELGRKFPREAHELLSKLSSYGLRVATGWHSGYLSERSVEAESKAAADHVQLLESCGCQVLVYGECGMMEGDSPWDEPLSRGTKLKSIDLAVYAERLTEFSVGLNRRGIKLAYHYHLKMWWRRRKKLPLFVRPRPGVGLLLDTGHAYAAGADSAKFSGALESSGTFIRRMSVAMSGLGTQNDVTFNSAVREGLFTSQATAMSIFGNRQICSVIRV
jgi:inosose dehydratase